jgi:hypothetical protein
MFLESTPKQLTAIQVSNWLNSCETSMKQAKDSFESIKTWLIASSENEDYSDEDRAEVMQKLQELK